MTASTSTMNPYGSWEESASPTVKIFVLFVPLEQNSPQDRADRGSSRSLSLLGNVFHYTGFSLKTMS